MTIDFRVRGTPGAWARPRANGKRFFNSAEHERSLGNVQQAFSATVGPEWAPHEGPVHMTVQAFFLRPKEGWPGRPCTKRPDCDNLGKLVGDALNGVAYRDDSQIVTLTVSKTYTDLAERTEVSLVLLPAVPKPKKTRAKKEQAK